MARQRGGRSPVEMTPERVQRRAEVARAYAEYEAKRDRERLALQREIGAQVDARSAEELGALRQAIRAALNAGLPKSQLQVHDVLGSADQGKVNRIMGGKVKRQRTPQPSLEWLEDGAARVMIPGYPTTSLADDYPEALSGVVRRDGRVAGGWAVEVDDTDEPGVPGHLRWEFEHEPAAIGETIERLAESTP
ncbi:MAG TPA: hypothetical protein VFM87_08675 [Agrococcus sp.]|nr:hypothetical protein [Agrococcus sp.]